MRGRRMPVGDDRVRVFLQHVACGARCTNGDVLSGSGDGHHHVCDGDAERPSIIF